MVYNLVESVSFIYIFLWCHSGHTYNAPFTAFTRSVIVSKYIVDGCVVLTTVTGLTLSWAALIISPLSLFTIM